MYLQRTLKYQPGTHCRVLCARREGVGHEPALDFDVVYNISFFSVILGGQEAEPNT